MSISKISLRVFFLWMDEIREFGRIPDKEHGGIISYHIIISIFGVEFNSKSSRISLCIIGTLFSSYGRKSSENRGSFSNGIKEFSFCIFCYIVGYFKISPSTRSLGMNNSFRNSFSVEMSKLINKMGVLDDNRTIFTGGHWVFIIINRRSPGRSQNSFCNV